MDLGDRSSRYCILDEQGEVISEGSLTTTKKGFARVFGKTRGAESRWKSERILLGEPISGELGHEVMVANARRVRLITDSSRKDDRLDAKTLARLARIDPELPQSDAAS